MGGIGICTKCGTIERTKEDWDTHVCPQPLKENGTQPTDVQQLKAEIASVEKWLSAIEGLGMYPEVGRVCERLRQLSAI